MPLFLSPTTGLSEEGEDMYLYSQHSAWATWEATPRQGSASKNNKLKGGGDTEGLNRTSGSPTMALQMGRGYPVCGHTGEGGCHSAANSRCIEGWEH